MVTGRMVPRMRQHHVRSVLAIMACVTLLLTFVGIEDHQHGGEMARLMLPCKMCRYQSLYGNHTVLKYNSQGVCKQQVLVMGLHNSGTSMVARLLTLLGLWAGEETELSIGKTNKLKWWERFDVMTTNDRLTVNHTNPNHPTWIGFGFDPALVLPHERSRFQQEALSILKSLRHHCPFVIKDPRLAYVGEMWMELMDSPVCVITYRHPARVAQRLGNHWYKGHNAKLDTDAWLAVWEFMMTSSLKTCRGRPTVLVQSVLAKPETLDVFYDTVIPALHAVGIKDIVRPTKEVLQEHFVKYYRPTHKMKSPQHEAMSQRCEYAEVKPVNASIMQRGAGFMNYMDLLKAWPETCAVKGSDRTRALVMAFEKVLMQQYTARMKVPPKLLAQTVLKYQEDILYDMSVAAQSD